MICKQCSHELPQPAPEFCPYCGIALSDSTSFAPQSTTSFGNQSSYYCPWEDREKLGFMNAFWLTIKSVMTEPTLFFQRLSPEGNFGSAIGYGVIAGSIGMIAGILWQLLFQAMQLSVMFPMMHQNTTALAGQMGIQAIIMIGLAVASPLLVLIGIFISAAITHFFLWILGGANKPFESTVRVVSYSMSATVINIIPFCGGYIGSIWGLVLEIIGLKEVHQTTFGKSIAAKLLPMVCCCCCVCIGIIIIAITIGASFSNPDALKQLLQKLTNP